MYTRVIAIFANDEEKEKNKNSNEVLLTHISGTA